MDTLKWFDRLPAGIRIRRLLKTIWAELTFAQACAPGHFYSPIPARSEIERDKERIFRQGLVSLPEIDLCESAQLQLFSRLTSHTQGFALPTTPQSGKRYYIRNDYFNLADATMLAAMMAEYRPRRYLEIGSGFSSALALDINESHLGSQLQAIFIDPSTDRLKELLRPNDEAGVQVYQKRIQEMPDAAFGILSENDILFIDGSHVSKVGSDLNDILFRVLPLLRSGVLIHFHDIFWPFEYSPKKIFAGISWNEAYILRAFLANNVSYKVKLFGSWLENCHPEIWQSAFSTADASLASSIWLQKK